MGRQAAGDVRGGNVGRGDETRESGRWGKVGTVGGRSTGRESGDERGDEAGVRSILDRRRSRRAGARRRLNTGCSGNEWRFPGGGLRRLVGADRRGPCRRSAEGDGAVAAVAVVVGAYVMVDVVRAFVLMVVVVRKNG